MHLLASVLLAAVSMTFSAPAAVAVHPLPLDPKISDPAWSAGAIPAPGGFYDLTARRAAPYATSVWMLYDTDNLYVAFRCEQQGTPITGAQTTNDVGFGLDDFVGVEVDPSGAGTDAYIFETTPRGVRYEQASETNRYRPTWSAAASIDGSTWSAVLVIPLHVMRIHPGSPQTWRINFVRNVAASAEHYTWAYNGAMQDGPVGQQWPGFYDTRYWAAWRGVKVSAAMLQAARPKPRAELYGLESIGRDRDRFAQANGAFATQHVRVTGLDLTYPITPTINFVGTLNPDFSNVEIDQQTIAPQEFQRTLQEYRPFFSQGASFINADAASIGPNLVFYSPSVGPFDRGEKVEGTFGDQSFGLLNFRGFDQTTGNTFDDTAFGYKHALQNRTFLYWADGVLAHHSMFGDDSTAEYGVAGRNLKTGFVWGLDRADEHGSWNALESAGLLNQAHNTNGFIDVHQHNYEWNLAFVDITPFYNPIDGYTQASDERGPQLFTWVAGSTHSVKNYMLNLFADRLVDRSGAAHVADFDPALNATFTNGLSLNGLGPSIGELRSYSLIPASGAACANVPLGAYSYFTGYPNYYCGRTDSYNLMNIPIGYRDGTATPVDFATSFGRFGYGLLGPGDHGQDFVNLYSISTSRPIGRMLSLGLEYDGTRERGIASGMADSQWLRRISIGALLGPDENFTISLRAINGRGGFALPGTNLAAAYHRRFRNGDELFLNYGTPASPYTLNRFIMKYIFRVGGEAGT
ncbi:MAG TPA: DUF5916 domain-containing protein [Candidatus Baltobacteraceae bacterium]|nr:DUF5916 domain-containing protein [Candidatus Baltobacteraceae bacterium]